MSRVEDKPKTTSRKAVTKADTAPVDMTAKAILYTAYMKKGYGQVMAIEATNQVYKELEK